MPSLDKAQLKKLLLIALSSDQPGEVNAAINKVRAALKKAGLDIHWLAGLIDGEPARPSPSPTPQRHSFHVDWWDQLTYCQEHGRGLNWREQDFIESLSLQFAARDDNWEPSLKQLKWLADIYVKLQQRS